MTAAVYSSRPLPLFDKYGGIKTLRHVIMEFYDRVLDSDLIGHFFEDTDIALLYYSLEGEHNIIRDRYMFRKNNHRIEKYVMHHRIFIKK